MYECGFFSYNVLYNGKKILIFTNIFLWVSNRFKVLNEEALSATFKTFSGMYKPHPYTISASYNNTNYHFRSFISLHKLYLLSSSDMKLLFSMTPMIIYQYVNIIRFMSMPWKIEHLDYHSFHFFIYVVTFAT